MGDAIVDGQFIVVRLSKSKEVHGAPSGEAPFCNDEVTLLLDYP